MRIRKTFWVSRLCRAHWKDLRWGIYFETDFLLSIRHYEIQFLICLKALHANQKQRDRPDPQIQHQKSTTGKAHALQRLGLCQPCHTASYLLPKYIFFSFHFKLVGMLHNPPSLPATAAKAERNSTLGAEILVNGFSLEHKL